MVTGWNHLYAIKSLLAFDIRFPTSLTLAGSDAIHKDPDYSCAYVIITLSDSPVEGHGFSFTIGHGTEIVVRAIESFRFLVEGRKLDTIFSDFGSFYHKLVSDSQLRWLGPEKGVVHMAVAAILNALWDLLAKLEQKPLWRLVSDFTPEQFISVVDFHHISDALTKDDAMEILKRNISTKQERIYQIERSGVPAYISSIAWMGYSDEKVRYLSGKYLSEGWTAFKMKVGESAEDDHRRASIIRDEIGYKNRLMMDANQVWEASEAVDRMEKLSSFKPLWIEEPTHPDDILGHKMISEALSHLDVGVASGEHCSNRVLFKQFLSSGAIQFCQIDACRLASVNEVLSVLLMAAKYQIPVCPHAGGVGLCELVQHLAIINFLCIAPTFHNTMVEYADHLHEYFVSPVTIKNGSYWPPQEPGYSSELTKEAILCYQYPKGSVWQDLIQSGKHKPRF